jgi:trk system potassium uptake protein TrkH
VSASNPSRVRPSIGVMLNRQRALFLRFPTAIALVELAAAFAISAIVDLFDDAEVTVEFLACAMLLGTVGGLELRRIDRPRVASAPAVMTMVSVGWFILGLGAAAAHLVAGATSQVDTAVFEGMAAASTTSMTALDPDSLPMGMHLFRSLIQWVSGLSGLMMAVVVIPLVFGGREFDGRGQSRTMGRTLITGRTKGIHRIAIIYLGFTITVVLGFVIAGLGAFDAVAHALTTVSTGGLSTRTGSLGAFGKPAVEWVAAVSMALAGTSIGVVWWVLHGDREPVRRSTEFGVYVSVMAAAVVALALWLESGFASLGSVRTGFLAVTSAMSTTGFTSTPWGEFDKGAQTVLLVLVAIGAMAGSTGGGFKYIRMIEASRFAHRELERHLHPTAVGVVRFNGRAVGERSLENLNGYIVVYPLTLIAGAMAISLGGETIPPQSALTLAVSALSTAGPQLAEPVDFAQLGVVTKLSLSILLFMGRLSIYAVILTASNVVARLARSNDMRQHRRR